MITYVALHAQPILHACQICITQLHGSGGGSAPAPTSTSTGSSGDNTGLGVVALIFVLWKVIPGLLRAMGSTSGEKKSGQKGWKNDKKG